MNCPRCDRQLSTDAFLCGTCAREAATDLHGIAYFLPHIDDKRARRGSRLWIGRGSTPAETPLPYDARVGKVLAPIVRTLNKWAALHTAAHFDHEARPSQLADTANWLAEYTEWAATQEWALEAFEAYAEARDSLEKLFDAPPEREAIGVCGAVHESAPDYPCPEILSAVKGETNHSCPRCHAVHNVDERRATLLEQAADFTVTVAEAVRLLRTTDRDINPRLVRACIRFVPIQASGDRLELDTQGRSRRVNVYRLGAVRDALTLHESDGEARKLINRLVRVS